MKRYQFGFDHRLRICGQCHGWFLSEGVHTRFCAPCRAEAKRSLEWTWQSDQADVIDHDDIAMTAREPVAG